MTLEELLEAYKPERWQQMAGSDRYRVLLKTQLLLLSDAITVEQKEGLRESRTSASAWLHNEFIKR